MYDTIKQSKINEIFLVEEKIKSALILKPTVLGNYFSNFLFNGAKRLRPLFIFLVCDLFGYKINEEVINLAVGVELLHSASLIHDDILDNGKLRRGNVAIHLEKGVKTGVLAGDYLLSLSMNFFSKINNPEIFEIMGNASYAMTKSELEALNLRFQKPNIETYIKISKEKTSSLFIAAIKALGKIQKTKIDENIIKFTENFSLCFQIKDDINNFSGKDKNKISSDVKEGVYTLPFILENNTIDEADVFLDNLIYETKNLLKDYKNKDKLTELLDLFKGKENGRRE